MCFHEIHFILDYFSGSVRGVGVPRRLLLRRGALLQFVVLAAAVLSCVAFIVAAWVGTGALAAAAALLCIAACRARTAAWVRAAAV